MHQFTQKQKFIFSEISILAWAASVQRVRLYNAELKPKNRKSVEFRAEVLRFIESELLPCYKSECDEPPGTLKILRGLLISELI
ncbi:hypothetical protein BVY06_20475 [Pectobacterium odoriferum]|nr:hypothetical protein BVY06_20475 [Pectobacterium odoriferum]